MKNRQQYFQYKILKEKLSPPVLFFIICNYQCVQNLNILFLFINPVISELKQSSVCLPCYFFRKSVTRQTCHLSSSGWRDDKNKITSEENCRNKNAFIILCKFSFFASTGSRWCNFLLCQGKVGIFPDQGDYTDYVNYRKAWGELMAIF